MAENKHTPTPWSFTHRSIEYNYFNYDIQGNVGVKVWGSDPIIGTIALKDHCRHDGKLDSEGQNYMNVENIDPEANIKHIIHCVNTHDELVEALEHIIEYWNQDRNDGAMHDALWHIIETAESALKKATN